MTHFMDRLTPVIDHKNDPTYAEAEIRRVADKVVALDAGQPPNGLLAVCIDSDGHCIDVALFDFASSNMDGTDVVYGRVMHGCGYGGVLRELRHTYWGEPGENGYIFYPSRALIVAALDALTEWFDLD